ncbi:MAG: hypothetical protein ACOYYF_15295 [Chloroflexota bacterium]
MTHYIAIFETAEGDKFVIDYRPAYDEMAGAIEILNIEYIQRPRSPWEIWDKQRREHKQLKMFVE